MDSAPDATPDFVSGNPVLCFVVGHTEDTPRLAECVASVVGAGVGSDDLTNMVTFISLSQLAL